TKTPSRRRRGFRGRRFEGLVAAFAVLVQQGDGLAGAAGLHDQHDTSEAGDGGDASRGALVHIGGHAGGRVEVVLPLLVGAIPDVDGGPVRGRNALGEGV